MSVDPELASVPGQADEGNTTSPLYLAILLHKEDIAAHLIHKTNGNLSCTGPDGRNVLHAAVTRRKGTSIIPCILLSKLHPQYDNLSGVCRLVKKFVKC